MQLPHSDEILRRQALFYGDKLLTTNQISMRLKKILPERLAKIKRDFRRSEPAGRASRLALVDPMYEKHVKELNDIQASAFEARILWETHRQLIDARRSMRSHQKALLNARK